MTNHLEVGKIPFALKCAWNAFESTMKLHGMTSTQWDAFVFEFGSSGGYGRVKACMDEFWKEEE